MHAKLLIVVLLLATSPFISGAVAMDVVSLFSNGDNSASVWRFDTTSPSEPRSGWEFDGSYDLTGPLADRAGTFGPPASVETVGPWTDMARFDKFNGWIPCCYGGRADISTKEKEGWAAADGIFDCTCQKTSRAGMYGEPVGEEPFSPWG